MLLKKSFHKRISFIIAALLTVCLVTPAYSTSTVDKMSMVNNLNMVTDILVGRGTKGPYYLSWTNFDSNSISVVVNGRTIRSGIDYTVDVSKGTISFNSILASDAISRATYQLIANKSKKSASNISSPITLNLFQKSSSSLQMTGLFTQSDQDSSDVDKSVVGINGAKSWGINKITSQFLVSQKNDNSSGETWDRSAFKLGGDTGLGALKLSGSMLHAGGEFAGASEYGTGSGKDTTNLSASFASGKALQASATLKGTKDNYGDGKGDNSTTNQQSLVYSPLSSTKLSLQHSSSDTYTAASNSDTSKDVTTVKLNQAIGAKTSALASFEDSTSATNDVENNIKTSNIKLTSSAFSKTTMSTSLTQKYSDENGKEQQFSFGASTKPVDQVSLDVGYGTTDNETDGHQTSTSVKVVASPSKNVQIQGSVKDNNLNDSNNSQKDFSLSSTPAQFAKLIATFSEKDADTEDDNMSKGATLQLTPVKNTKLTAGYKYTESGAQIMRIQDYAAELKPWNLLSLNGSYRYRDSSDTDSPDTSAMSLSLVPTKLFTLTGTYQLNPEDSSGAIQNINSKALSVATQIGSFGLTTKYSCKDEYILDRFSDEKNVGLVMPFFGNGKLTTGWKMSRLLDGSNTATQTYSLGYSHSVGSDFSLSLTGYYTEYLQNQMVMPDKTEYSAEASLGIKF